MSVIFQICLSCVMRKKCMCMCACVRSCSVGCAGVYVTHVRHPFCLSPGRLCASCRQDVSIYCRSLVFFLLWVVCLTVVGAVSKTGRSHAEISRRIVCFFVPSLVGVAYWSYVPKNGQIPGVISRTSLFLRDSACW